MWSFNDLMMMINDRDNSTKAELKTTLYYAKLQLEQMDKELRDLRPIGEAIQRLAVKAIGISNG